MKTKEISDQNYVLLFFQISVVKFFIVYRKISRSASIFSLIMGAILVSRIRIPNADTVRIQERECGSGSEIIEMSTVPYLSDTQREGRNGLLKWGG